jgi:hypothetical protein
MLELLYGENWFNIQNSAEAVQDQIDFFGEDSLTGKWLRENGAKESVEPATANSEGQDGDKGDQSHGKGRRKGKGKGGESRKGASNGNASKRPTPDQIHQWFGDVPW